MPTDESRASNQRSSARPRRWFSRRAKTGTRNRRPFSWRVETRTQSRRWFSRRAKPRTRNRRVLLSPRSTALVQTLRLWRDKM
jgi:hypothetical protein